jgi:hypothetical protein
MARAVRVAADGLGSVARDRHLPAMKRIPKFEAAGVVTVRSKRLLHHDQS